MAKRPLFGAALCMSVKQKNGSNDIVIAAVFAVVS